MQHGLQQRLRSRVAQRFFALFYRLSTQPTTRSIVCRRTIGSTRTCGDKQQPLFPSPLKQIDPGVAKALSVKGRAQRTGTVVRRVGARKRSAARSPAVSSIAPNRSIHDATQSASQQSALDGKLLQHSKAVQARALVRNVADIISQQASASDSTTPSEFEEIRRKMMNLTLQMAMLWNKSPAHAVPSDGAAATAPRAAATAAKPQPRRKRGKRVSEPTTHPSKEELGLSVQDYMRHIYARAPELQKHKERTRSKSTKVDWQLSVSPAKVSGLPGTSNGEINTAEAGSESQREALGENAPPHTTTHLFPDEDVDTSCGMHNVDMSNRMSVGHPHETADLSDARVSRMTMPDSLRENISAPSEEDSRQLEAQQTEHTRQTRRVIQDVKLDRPRQKERLRHLMRYIPSPVVVITTCAPEYDETMGKSRQLYALKKTRTIKPEEHVDRHYRAIAVSSFTTVSFGDEPIVSFNVKVPSRALDGIKHWSQFYVHMFDGAEQAARIAHAFTQGDATAGFSSVVGDIRIAHPLALNPDSPSLTMAPRVHSDTNVAVLTCKILKVVTVADHEVVFATVRMVDLGPKWRTWKGGKGPPPFSGLMYHGGAYKCVGEVLLVPPIKGAVDAKMKSANKGKKEALPNQTK